MASLTYGYSYRDFDVTIIGYQLPHGWRLAVEIRGADSYRVIRDNEAIYPEFNSLRSMGIWIAHLEIRKLTEAPGLKGDRPIGGCDAASLTDAS